MRRTCSATALAVLVFCALAAVHAEEKKLPQDTVRERLIANGAQVQQDGTLAMNVGKTEVGWHMGAFERSFVFNTAFFCAMRIEDDGQPVPRQLPENVIATWTDAAKDILDPAQIEMGKKALKDVWRWYFGSVEQAKKIGKPMTTEEFEGYFAYGEPLSAVALIFKKPGWYYWRVDFEWSDPKSADAVASLDRFAKTHPGQRMDIQDVRARNLAQAKFDALKAAGKPAVKPAEIVRPPDQNPAWARDKFMANTLPWKTLFDFADLPLDRALFQLGLKRACTTVCSLGDAKLPRITLSVKDTAMREIYEKLITGADVEGEIVEEAVFVFKKGWYPHQIDRMPNAETKQAVASALVKLNGTAADQDLGKQGLRKLGVQALSELRLACQSTKDEALRARIAAIYPELVGPMWFYEDPATTAALNALGTKETFNQVISAKRSLAERIDFFKKCVQMKTPPRIELAPDVADRYSEVSLSPMKYGNVLRWLARLHGAKIVVENDVFRFVNFTPSPTDPPLTLSLGTDPVLPLEAPAIKPPRPPNSEF